MCIDDNKRRESRPITIYTADTKINLDSIGTQDLESIELMGYNIQGIPIPSGYPYVDYFLLRLSGNGVESPYISTYEQGLGSSSYNGIDLQLTGFTTSVIYATPKPLFKRLGDGFGGKTNLSIDVNIITNNGSTVNFDRMTLFLNYVYPAEGIKREIGKMAALSQHNKTFI